MQTQPDYMRMEEVQKEVPSAQNMQQYAESLAEEEPTLVLRDYDEPTSPPYLEEGVEVLGVAIREHPLLACGID